MRTAAPLCLLFTLACNGGGTDDTSSTDTGAEDTGGTEDTGADLRALTQHGYFVNFGWDDTSGTTRSYTVDGAEVTSTLELTLLTPDFTFEPHNENNRCVLRYDINGLNDTTFDGSDGYALALEFTLDPTKVVEDTCTPRVGTVFDPAAFVDSPTADVSNWVIRLAIGGDLDANLKTLIDDDPADEYDSTDAFGGQIRLPYQDDEEPSVTEMAIWGNVADTAFVVEQDGDGNPTRIAPDAVESTDALVDGMYEIVAQFNWRFDSSL